MKNKQFFVQISFWVGSVAILLWLAWIFIWPIGAKYIIDQQFENLSDRWNSRASYDSLDIQGLTFRFKNIYLMGSLPEKAPLLQVTDLEIQLGISQLLNRSRIPESVTIDSMAMYVVKKDDGRWNFQSIPDSSAISNDKPSTLPVIAGPFQWLLNKILNKNHPEVSVTNTRISIRTPDYSWRIDSLTLLLKGESGKIRMKGPQNHLMATASFPGDSLMVTVPDAFRLTLPLPSESPLILTGSAGSFSMKRVEGTRYSFEGGYQNLGINHPALAPGVAVFRSFFGKTDITFSGQEKMEISSVFNPGDLTIGNTIHWDQTDGNLVLGLDFLVSPASSLQYKRSLPTAFTGLLSEFRFTGNLGYQLSSVIDFSNPDSLKLSGEVLKENYRTLATGAPFSMLDSSFYVTVYDGLDSAGTIRIGPENPDFIPFGQIPPHLTGAILTNEDGMFMNHRGFNEEAFRLALIDNIKNGEFKRGASTISMQLVKNLYLNRRKNLSRKFQELVLTWLLENERPVSKERMLEIYLNMIEWGPGVYGITQASRFYFSKKPQELTPEESLFLAILVPSPKKFTYRFRKGHLSPVVVETMEFIAGKMVRAERLDSVSYSQLNWESFQLKGPASAYLGGSDTSSVIPDLDADN